VRLHSRLSKSIDTTRSLRRRKTKFKLFPGVVLSQSHRNFIAEWRDENRWKHSLTGRSECMFATSIPECVSFDYCSWYLLAETVSLRCTGYHLHVVGLHSCKRLQASTTLASMDRSRCLESCTCMHSVDYTKILAALHDLSVMVVVCSPEGSQRASATAHVRFVQREWRVRQTWDRSKLSVWLLRTCALIN